MYKQLIVIIILFSIPYSISAQPGFSIAQGVGYFPIEFNEALVRNDTIVTYGLGRDSTNNGAQGVVLAKFDSSGNLIKSKIIVHPTNSGFFAGGGILSSGNVIAAGTCNEGNTNYAWLVKVKWASSCGKGYYCRINI